MALLAQVSAAGVSSPAAETAVLTTPVISAAVGVTPHISGAIDVTEGTGGTAYVIRIRQGNGLGGTIVGQAETDTIAAAASGPAEFAFDDATNWLDQAGGGQYTLTVAETGASSPGNIITVEMSVEV